MNIMKPIASTTIPSGKDWLFEIKYDGFRCVLDWDINNIKLTSKNNKELTDQFPEIVEFCLEKQDLLKSFFPIRLDGELVILNTAFQANFPEIQKRGRLKNPNKIKQLAEKRPATLMAFDILQLNDAFLENSTFEERKTQLRKIIELIGRKEHRISLVDTSDSSDDLWRLTFDYKAEGLVAKRKNSTYQSGKGHHDWFKVKNWRLIQGILHSYHVTNGYFSVNVWKDDELQFIGKCKHGLKDETLHTLKEIFLTRGTKQNNEYILPPAIVANIHTLDLYDGELREPEFNQLSVHTPAKECTYDKLNQNLAMFPPNVDLSKLDKIFWSEPNLTKGNLLTYMREIAPYMLPFMKQRALTLIRCPDGVNGEHFFQKHLPDYAPEYVNYFMTEDDKRGILCDTLEPLLWFANHGAIEYHVPFQKFAETMPIEIVFDLDPPCREKFHYAIEAALLIKKILDDVELVSFIKSSGNKGLQVHIPIPKNSFNYDETAIFTQAVAWTVERMDPEKFTTERFKKKRGGRLYIDYVQHGKDKTLIAPYSPRKTTDATVAMPLFWEEITRDLRPEPFTLDSVIELVQERGCPFMNYFEIGEAQRLNKLKKLIMG